ncbi:type II/IV secretion system protein, partial [Patescibacteria group bacterium]
MALAEVLKQRKFISENELDEALKASQAQGIDLKEVLLEKGLINLEKLTEAEALDFGLPYVDLKDKVIKKEVLDSIPEKAALTYHFVPFTKEGNLLKVALQDPTDLKALEALEFIKSQGNLEIENYLASPDGVKFALNQYGSAEKEVGKVLREAEKEKRSKVVKLQKEIEATQAKEEKITTETPISKTVAILLRYAIQAKASDVHIEPERDIVKIRYRVDGILRQVLTLPKQIHAAIVSRIKILANLKIDEQRKPQDGRFFLEVDKKEIDLRVSVLPTVNGEKVVMRILDREAGILTLDQLGVVGRGREILEHQVKEPYGMILVTGPTGSGKTTTLYALLSALNTPAVNIVTLEDPVEYQLQNINQSQVNYEVKYTFATGLRSIVRQDPDIIMVGEIRDNETAEMATHAALTGHVMLSTVHTMDAVGTIPRLIDMGVEPFLIASALNTIVSQRLVRKICQKCRKKSILDPKTTNLIKKTLTGIPISELEGINLDKPLEVYEPQGCDQCSDTGYKGRLGIFEVLPVEGRFQEAVLKRLPIRELEKVAKEEGMIDLKQDGFLKVLRG